MNWRNVGAAILIISSLAAALAGCGNKGDVIRVSSKEFTEQLLLGELAVVALENAGYQVDDKTGIAGSNKLRTALLDSDIDIYWEYTGTGWLMHLQHDTGLADPQDCYERVKAEDAKNGVDWLPYAAINNTYTILISRKKAEALRVRALSDLAPHLDALSFAVDHEFTARPDGLPGLVAAYGFKIPDEKIVVMDNALIYKPLKDGQVDLGMGFATDGRIRAFDLVGLVDDHKFFPAYNPAPNLRIDFAKKNPKIVHILEAIAAKLTNDAIIRMNYEVDIQQKAPKDVATAWLKEGGLLGK
jgi:osmoprotectant transport system substrate-binding protein